MQISSLNTSTMAPQVFFITGTSTGFGNELVKKALKEGDKVVATARNSSKLKFDGATNDNFLAVDLDVTDTASVDKAFDAALKKFGRIDVVLVFPLSLSSLSLPLPLPLPLPLFLSLSLLSSSLFLSRFLPPSPTAH